MISGIDTNANNIIAIHKEYSISKYNWTLEFIFKQDSYSVHEANAISLALQDLLDTQHRKMLVQLLDKNTYNSALAVSNNSDRRSIIILTQVTDMSQFVNSLCHEILHLSRHIDECNNNEELFTTLGNIAGEIVKELYSL